MASFIRRHLLHLSLSCYWQYCVAIFGQVTCIAVYLYVLWCHLWWFTAVGSTYRGIINIKVPFGGGLHEVPADDVSHRYTLYIDCDTLPATNLHVNRWSIVPRFSVRSPHHKVMNAKMCSFVNLFGTHIESQTGLSWRKPHWVNPQVPFSKE